MDGTCSENLHRLILLQSCPSGDDVCASLSCSPNAACNNIINTSNFKCVCLPEFYGDGSACKMKENGTVGAIDDTNG